MHGLYKGFSQQGLVAHWGFNESSGALVKNRFLKNDITLVNGPTRTPGKIGNAVVLDGVDQGGTYPISVLANEVGTISHWVYPDTHRRQILIMEADDNDDGFTTTANAFMIHTAIETDGSAYFVYQDGLGLGGKFLELTGSVIPIGQLTHFAATFDVNADMKIYLNGVLDVTGDLSAIALGGSPLGFVRTIGTDTEVTPSLHWGGRMDDLRVYNRVLSAAEIASLAGLGV